MYSAEFLIISIFPSNIFELFFLECIGCKEIHSHFTCIYSAKITDKNVHRAYTRKLFHMKKKARSRRYPAEIMTDAVYADDLAFLANTPAESLQCRIEQAPRGIGLNMNVNKTMYMCFKSKVSHFHFHFQRQAPQISRQVHILRQQYLID